MKTIHECDEVAIPGRGVAPLKLGECLRRRSEDGWELFQAILDEKQDVFFLFWKRSAGNG